MWSPWAIVWRCLRDPRFIRLSRTMTCDIQMGEQTDTMTASAALA